MSDRLSGLEAHLQHLDELVACLARRLDALEGRLPPVGAVRPAEATLTTGGQGAAVPVRADHIILLTLIGRTLMVVGGAYLLRALTQSGQISLSGGVILGLLYAVVWLAAAERAPSAASGVFHGLSAVIIGLPIVWEASTRFPLFSPTVSAVVLAVVVALTVAVAWHRGLQLLALAGVAGSFVVTLALAVQVGPPLIFAVVWLTVAAAFLWIGYHRRWMGLAVLTAVTMDVVIVALAARASAVPPRDPVVPVLALHASFLAAYLGSFTLRSLLLRRPLGAFEFGQAALALAVSLGGAIMITRANGLAVSVIGTAAATAALGAYVAAFTPALARRGAISGWYFFSSLGFVLAVVAASLLLSRPALVVALTAIALAGLAQRARARVPALAVQSAIALLVAAAVSGWGSLAATVWLTGLTEWPAPSAPVWVVMLAAVLCLGLATRRDVGSTSITVLSVVRTCFAVLAVAGLCTLIVIQAGPVLIPASDAGGLATLKSIVLAAAAMLLALTPGVPAVAALSRLTYPLLIAGGVKILVEDLPASRPATLFVSLGFYGAALILTPRVLKSHRGVRFAVR